MGEVFRAHDPRLGRDVALKVLHQQLERDEDFLRRFEREARLLASLNHPNVESIYGFEEFEGVRFLVLELVPGTTLAERIFEGPLTLQEALEVARQIASALEAAHSRGVVHRDLKPGNIHITPGGAVKVLDFGLARSLTPSPSGIDSKSPTLASSTTQAGTILGTPAYMSPEQVRGQVADERSDLWALGCVLYEMLTGRQSFGGATASDCLAAVLTREPDLATLPPATPARVRALLSRCLQKNPAGRPANANEVRHELEELLREMDGKGRVPRSRVVPFAVAAGLVLILAGALVIGLRGTRAVSHPLPRLSQVTFAEGVEEFPALSSDGRFLAYVAAVGPVRKIFVKELASGEEHVVTQGPADDLQPEWRPDGKALLFVRARKPGEKLQPGDVFGAYVDADVWSADLEAKSETRLVENAFNPAYSPDGTRIAVDAPWAGPRRIWSTDALGHNPQQLSSDASEEVMHVRPRWSRDGRLIVFQNQEKTQFDIRILDVASRKTTWVTHDLFQDLNPVFSPSGRWVYFSSYRTGGLNVWRAAVTPAGDPRGPPEQVTAGAGQDVELSLAGRGHLMALSILKQNADLWELPVDPATGLAKGAPASVVSTTREESRGSVSPDGRAVAFNSDRSGSMCLWLLSRKDGRMRALTLGLGSDYQPSWFPDGHRLAFFSSRGGNVDIWSVDTTTAVLTQLTKNPAVDMNPCVSPDGSEIAFQSDRSGRPEVWIMRSDGSAQRALTSIGVIGHFLRFTKEGSEILFRSPSGDKPATMRVPRAGGEPRATMEVKGGSHMSLSPDGLRIMDVVAHSTLWVSHLHGGAPEKVFEFPEHGVRIDYPVWSPDGREVIFDRFKPEGGDIWLMDEVE